MTFHPADFGCRRFPATLAQGEKALASQQTPPKIRLRHQGRSTWDEPRPCKLIAFWEGREFEAGRYQAACQGGSGWSNSRRSVWDVDADGGWPEAERITMQRN